MLGFTLLWAVVALLSPLFMVQNSIGMLRPQLFSWPLFLTLSLATKLVVGNSQGAEWVPLAGAAVYTVVMVPAAVSGYRKVLRTMTEVTR